MRRAVDQTLSSVGRLPLVGAVLAEPTATDATEIGGAATLASTLSDRQERQHHTQCRFPVGWRRVRTHQVYRGGENARIRSRSPGDWTAL